MMYIGQQGVGKGFDRAVGAKTSPTQRYMGRNPVALL